MAELNVGGVTPSKIFYGSTPVKAVYYGSVKIWPAYPRWSRSVKYRVGDIVTFDGKYYQLVKPVSFQFKVLYPGSRGWDIFWQEVSPG